MLGMAALALLLALIRGLDLDPVRSSGLGHTTIPLGFVVYDADSEKLIEGATIRLQDYDYLPGPDPNPPYVLNLKTGPDGQAMFMHNANVYMWKRSSPEWEWCIKYPLWEMRVAAEGYREFTASFEDFANQRGGTGSHKGTLPPVSPPIVVRLRKRARL
jgi:hypothetical protein